MKKNKRKSIGRTNNNIYRTLLIFVLSTSVIITGCIEENKAGAVPTPQKTSEIITPKETPIITPIETSSVINSGTDAIMERYSLDKLLSKADSIVVGEVIEILQSKWNTIDGKKPENRSDQSYYIYTDNRIKVGEYLKNPLSMETVTVRVLGGIVGQDKMVVEDQPFFSVNENVLVFLKKDDDARTKDVGGQHYVTVGAMQGKISILQNNEAIVGDEKVSMGDLRVRISGKGTKNTTSITI